MRALPALQEANFVSLQMKREVRVCAGAFFCFLKNIVVDQFVFVG